MPTILLTGGTGNAGSHVARQLLAHGYEILAVSRSKPDFHCRHLRRDLRDLEGISSEIESTDGIIHLASPRSQDARVTVEEDVLSFHIICRYWRKGSLIFASSQVVYGVAVGDICEDSAYHPCGWYDLGKIINELQLQMACMESGRGAGVSLRIPILFSTGRRRTDRQFMTDILEHCRKGGSFAFESEADLYANGTSFIGEEDFAAAAVAALRIDRTGEYNLAGGFCTWKELIECAHRFLGSRPRFILRRGGYSMPDELRLPSSRARLDCSKFQRAANWIPKEALDMLVARYFQEDQLENG